MRELTEEEHEIVNKAVNYHWSVHGRMWSFGRFDKDDVRQIAYEAIWRAIDTHDPEKSPLNFWQKMYVRGYLLNNFRSIHSDREPHTKLAEQLDQISPSINDPGVEAVESDSIETIYSILKQEVKTDRAVRVLVMANLENMDYGDIAATLGVRRQSLPEMKKNGKLRLQKIFKEKGIILDTGYNPNITPKKIRKDTNGSSRTKVR